MNRSPILSPYKIKCYPRKKPSKDATATYFPRLELNNISHLWKPVLFNPGGAFNLYFHAFLRGRCQYVLVDILSIRLLLSTGLCTCLLVTDDKDIMFAVQVSPPGIPSNIKTRTQQHQYSPANTHTVVASQAQPPFFCAIFRNRSYIIYLSCSFLQDFQDDGHCWRRAGGSTKVSTPWSILRRLKLPRVREKRDPSCPTLPALVDYNMSASVPMFEPQVLQVPCPDLSEDQELYPRRHRAYVLSFLDSPGLVVWRWVEQANVLLEQHRSTTTLDTPTAGTTSIIPPDKTASSRDSVETTHVQRPEGHRSVSNPRRSALRAMLGIILNGTPQASPTHSPTSHPPYHRRTPLPFSHTKLLAVLLFCVIVPAPVLAVHHAPAVILHIATGTSLAASATIPPLRVSSKVPAPWWIAMYATWGAAFVIFLTLELRRLPDWAQRRLLVGLFIFSGLNLTGSLVQGGDSMIEGMVSWSPLAMTASLLLVPMLMMFWGVRGAAEVAGAN